MHGSWTALSSKIFFFDASPARQIVRSLLGLLLNNPDDLLKKQRQKSIASKNHLW